MRKFLILGATAAAFALSGCGSEPTDAATDVATEPALDPALDTAVPVETGTPTDGALSSPTGAATETSGAMESGAMPAATPT